MQRRSPTDPEGAAPGALVVLGSANMDLVTRVSRLPAPGETISGRSFERTPGGKGLNQAVAAARAGARVAFAGCVGGDEMGERLIGLLADEGIDTAQVVVDGTASTGIALVAVLDGGENAIVVVPGANGSPRWDAGDAALMSGAAAVVAQLERPAALVRRAFEEARSRGVMTVLTPAPVTEEARGLLPLVDLLLLNGHEAVQLSGQGDPMAAAVQLSHVCPLVVMTRGSESTIAARGGAVVHEEPARRVDVVDTTGAGDCFAGNLVARLSTGEPLADALRSATIAASLSVGRSGASRAMPHLAEVRAVEASLA